MNSYLKDLSIILDNKEDLIKRRNILLDKVLCKLRWKVMTELLLIEASLGFLEGRHYERVTIGRNYGLFER